HTVRFPRSSVALPAVLLLCLSLGAPAVADPPNAPGSKASLAGEQHRAGQAEAALARVEDLLDGQELLQGGSDDHEDGRSLTIALRDLAALEDALTPAQRRRVAQINARPAFDATRCTTNICVHYPTNGSAAPDPTDSDNDGTPDYIEQVRDTTQEIHTTYVEAGYRRPKPDGRRGGRRNKVDIYIEDLGNLGLYGYCNSDEPNRPANRGDSSRWAYCVLDDDYAANEFGTRNTPLQNMQVTAAHEYFHAVQYAYDAFEDGWILESTATWVEDEVFDSVNDNRQYLRDSPLSSPQVPIDKFGRIHYGVWIWWRYLTEKFPARTGMLPNLVLATWNLLDGTPGAPDLYSTQALARVLKNRGTSLKSEFQFFSAANRHPHTVYEEGEASAYRAAPAAVTRRLGPGRTSLDTIAATVSHLASRTIRVNPRGLDAAGWRLRLAFDLPPASRGAAVVVTVYKRGGGMSTSTIPLDGTGVGSTTVPFSSAAVRGVDVVMINASRRFNCWVRQSSPFSCLGYSMDDKLQFKVKAKAFRS
uniref:MXAN_6640 family putative metalloprotease n=1 Tax=Nocardioides pelophilus TaxID=2172019 RepID=UPI001C809B5F